MSIDKIDEIDLDSKDKEILKEIVRLIEEEEFVIEELDEPIDTMKGELLTPNKIFIYNRKIVGLNIDKSETIPSIIGELSDLKKLTLNHKLAQKINFPMWISNLKNLENLTIRFSIDNISPSINKLQKLKILRLEFNDLDKVPDEIGALSGLEVLSLKRNQLSNLPISFSKLSNLRELDISDNKLEFIPKQVCRLVSLKFLSASNNFIKNLPSYINGLNSLEILKLRNNEINEISIGISSLNSLKKLELDENHKLRKTTKYICKLSSLEYLSLGYTSITTLPPCIGNLQNMKYLNLSSTQIISLPETIGNLKKLKRLSVISDNKDDLLRIPGTIANLQNLENLTIIANKRDNNSIPENITMLKNLKEVTIKAFKWPIPEIFNEWRTELRNNDCNVIIST